jgi:hypothetical protein
MATAAMLAAAPTATARARARGLGWKRCAIARSFSVPRWRPGASSRATPATTAALPSLTSESTWRLQFEFFSGKDPAATEPDRTVVAKVRFALDEGYEPPQGIVEIVEDDDNLFAGVLTNAAGTQMNNRWTLEEDPNERKAGLWIWGLFSEPLYPYLLFSLDVNRVEVAEGGYHVPAGTLFAEMKHARGSKQGSVLSDGTLSFKVTKTYQADLVGLSKVAVGEPNKCGRIKAECVA